jgi:hypothetical protein
MENQYKKMKTKMKSAKNLRQFLQGIQFFVKAKGIQINVFAPSKLIVKESKLRPNFQLDIESFRLAVNFFNDYQNSGLLLKINLSL